VSSPRGECQCANGGNTLNHVTDGSLAHYLIQCIWWHKTTFYLMLTVFYCSDLCNSVYSFKSALFTFRPLICIIIISNRFHSKTRLYTPVNNMTVSVEAIRYYCCQDCTTYHNKRSQVLNGCVNDSFGVKSVYLAYYFTKFQENWCKFELER
jgi:hypothetical protein